MEIQKAIKALKLFNEKAQELKDSKYFHIIRSQQTGFTISANSTGEIYVLLKSPDIESTKSFVLTFRFFIQDNERCSIRNIAKIYGELNIPLDIKDKFKEARNTLHNFLSSNSLLKLNNEPIKYEQILDVFFYGGLAHANEKKKEIFDRWMPDPIVSCILINEFNLILANIFNFILFTENLNNKIFEQIDK